MQTNLYFVRHAHSIYTPDEINRPLSESGIADVKRVAECLFGQRIDTVISSPYKRAIQTIEAVAESVDKEIIVMEDFRERQLSETSVDDFQFAVSKLWSNPAFSWKGGESNDTAQDRGIKATFEVLERYMGKNVVIGMHGNLMVLIMNYFDDRFDYTFWRNLTMLDVYKLTFEARKLLFVERLWKQD
ncbi:histidine phosphatase family protein [Oceanobacillus massiliensis]|uniref:histidine phosphatase family protein n=1 Tax=Oceanobacillus massiliensis TaxID=1465765 RepID=UPI00028A205C|nr:histidine phosphatase family protein [Oceanobacillus massiliensis]